MKKIAKAVLNILGKIETHFFMGILFFIIFGLFKVFYMLFSLLRDSSAKTNYKRYRDGKPVLKTFFKGY